MRRLKCVCGERQTNIWSAGFGTGLFLFCPKCKKEMRVEFNMKKMDSKKYIEKVKSDLIAKWNKEVESDRARASVVGR